MPFGYTVPALGKIKMCIKLYDMKRALCFHGPHNRYGHRMIAPDDHRKSTAGKYFLNSLMGVLHTTVWIHVYHIHITAIHNSNALK